MSASNNQGLNLFQSLRTIGGALATLTVVMFVVGIFAGGPIFAGIFGGLDQMLAWTVLLGAVAYVGYQTDEFGVGFTFTLFAILFLATPVLPNWLTQPFAFISEALLGMQFSTLDSVTMAVLLTATLIAYWAFDIRARGRAKRPGAIAGRMQVRVTTLANQYAKLSRVAVVTAFGVGFIFADQLGMVFGELIRMLGGQPVVSGYAGTLLAGFGSFVAGWPILGSLSAAQFGVLALIVFIIVVGAKYND